METTEILGVPALSLKSPESVDFQYQVDFLVLTNSGGGSTTASVAFVGTGCTDADWVGFQAGQIAIMWSGGLCYYRDRANMCGIWQASACLIANNATGGEPQLSRTSNVTSFPVFSLSNALGRTITSLIVDNPPGAVEMNVYADAQHIVVFTYNVLTCTATGDSNRTVLVGSHLDSVPAGPGINDNGSGSAINLELALQFAILGINPVNRVCFAWWSAEEVGLLGSTFYVNNLLQNDPQGLADIAVNINMDMVASPNYFRGIYDGNQAEPSIRNQSWTITQMFIQQFSQNELSYSLTDFDGRSDYGPFIEVVFSFSPTLLSLPCDLIN